LSITSLKEAVLRGLKGTSVSAYSKFHSKTKFLQWGPHLTWNGPSQKPHKLPLLQPISSCVAPAEAELAVILRPRAAQAHGLATLQKYLLSEGVPPKAGDLATRNTPKFTVHSTTYSLMDATLIPLQHLQQ
jgi:hypothetical protein